MLRLAGLRAVPELQGQKREATKGLGGQGLSSPGWTEHSWLRGHPGNAELEQILGVQEDFNSDPEAAAWFQEVPSENGATEPLISLLVLLFPEFCHESSVHTLTGRSSDSHKNQSLLILHPKTWVGVLALLLELQGQALLLNSHLPELGFELHLCKL